VCEQPLLVPVAVDEVEERRVQKVLEKATNQPQATNFPLCWRFFTR
jgi:hypothetical protein